MRIRLVIMYLNIWFKKTYFLFLKKYLLSFYLSFKLHCKASVQCVCATGHFFLVYYYAHSSSELTMGEKNRAGLSWQISKHDLKPLIWASWGILFTQLSPGRSLEGSGRGKHGTSPQKDENKQTQQLDGIDPWDWDAVEWFVILGYRFGRHTF